MTCLRANCVTGRSWPASVHTTDAIALSLEIRMADNHPTAEKLWQLVMGLRWMQSRGTGAAMVLEQRWYCAETGEHEWRPVEVVAYDD